MHAVASRWAKRWNKFNLGNPNAFGIVQGGMYNTCAKSLHGLVDIRYRF